MIVKKIENPKKSSTKATRIGRLADYIVNPQTENANEKCEYSGGRGFLTDSHDGRKAEMIALSAEAVRSKDTVTHYLLSWRAGEHPSPTQVEEAVSIFLRELGLSEHQAIYGLHLDTDNYHLHILVNRVHPDSLKVIKPNKGFDIEAGHRAIARIEHVQGWEREQNGRYWVLENGELGREHIDAEKAREPVQSKRDIENRTGEKSAVRIAIEDAAPIIKSVASWKELHEKLAAKGMRYVKTGSGATIFVGEVGVKASQVDREASLSKVQKRLGLYEPPISQLQVVVRTPEPIMKDTPGWKGYISLRKSHYASSAAARLVMTQRHEAERMQLAAEQKKRKGKVLCGDWKGRGDQLNALKSVVAAEHAAEKAALREKQKLQREQLRKQYRPFPDFEQWLREQQRPELAEDWRHRASEPQFMEGDTSEPPTSRDIRSYMAEVYGNQVHYTCKDEVGRGIGVSFVDRGREIAIYDWRSRDNVLAAMQLAAQKWGGFKVSGSPEYTAMCVKLAAEYGFRISNPELQESIRQERQRIQDARAQAMKSEQLKQFETYHDAVGADRYRVTSIKMRENGEKMTFILDKQDGVTKGFTPEEIAQRIPEMRGLQRRGENLYYTPLSDSKHYILIDDMSRTKLEYLIQDGYRPAVVLESSPGNYQAIITVPKLGTPHDKDVGNRLAERLNREYGDPKLSGCIHPHRAPGFENRKLKHQKADGSYPEVRLIKAERRDCGNTLDISREIDAEYRQQVELNKAQQPTRMRKLALAVDGSAVDAYQKHYRDVLKRQMGGQVDLSRVDSMIALRLRVTGHSRGDIENALRLCAPATREKDGGRNWDDYAQRTARYAFSPAGDRRASDLEKYRLQWRKLERHGEGQREDDEQVFRKQKAERGGSDLTM